ncbi:hypothetical protein L873DRAFT_1929634 [Choiromyces venosus 120613-1]|uniref:DDE Tnp4 domain-containing protein n=1 Tax=Choiromyces venosus 120613-1 TaxID=1336337 RepID=A0A3N4JGL4_9PEZI|nr:hypothetical protein L873DRAFT_1929634 [Choiromyces venosus 120613-1]
MQLVSGRNAHASDARFFFADGNLFRGIEELVIVLQFPAIIKADNRIIEDSRTALCMLLAHLAYPNRLIERISHISTKVQSLLHDKWKHLLEWDTVRLTPEKLLQYAQAVKRKGAPIDSRKHCLKYHAIVTPDGLISHLFGPVDGRRNDSFLWHESNLPTILQQHAWTPNGTPLQVYGDPAYNINQFLLSPYQGARITQNEQQWNCSMSCVWIVAEWAFKEMVNTFGFLDYVKNQKHLL